MEANHEARLRGQAEIWKSIFSFADSMALKCAVELRIPDIINSHGGPITLPQIVAGIPDASSPDIPCLARIMSLLVRRNIFTVHPSSDGSGEDTLYGLTHSSRWLLQDASPDHDTLSLAPMLLMQTDPSLMAPWHFFGTCVKRGGIAFKQAHGKEIWEFASGNSKFNKLFNDALGNTAKITMKAVMTEYIDGFSGLSLLVDVGGGTGAAVAEIVKSQPQIEGVNFDLPHVVAAAPAWPGVRHVGGDMFESIPSADAVFLKWIMHDWSDEDCVKILKNCRRAIPEKSGKVIIVDLVLEAEGNGVFEDSALVFDLLMLAHSSGGKERTRSQWANILKQAGFPRYNIIKIPALQSIIEAYPM